MQVNEINIGERAPQPFHVFCKNGYIATVTASAYRRELIPDDRIEFLDSKESPLPEYFFHTDAVSVIVPSSSLTDARNPFAQLEEQVKTLASRVNFLENNLPDIIVKAVRAAIRQGDI